jgi:hypothetical protein
MRESAGGRFQHSHRKIFRLSTEMQAAFALMQALKRSLPQPAGSIIISPWTDMACDAYEGGNMAVESEFCGSKLSCTSSCQMECGR